MDKWKVEVQPQKINLEKYGALILAGCLFRKLQSKPKSLKRGASIKNMRWKEWPHPFGGFPIAQWPRGILNIKIKLLIRVFLSLKNLFLAVSFSSEFL